MYLLKDSQEIENFIEEIAEVDILWLDTETADYNTKNPRLSLIQVLAYPHDLTGSRTCLLDVLELPEVVEMFIEKIMQNEQIEKIFHNAGYDLRFLGRDRAKNVTCTWEMAKKIPRHLLPLDSLSLKSLAENLANFKEVNKEEQRSDWGKRPLTNEQLHYAAMDTVYLAQVHQRLLKLLDNIPTVFKSGNLATLSQRYAEIVEQWSALDAEIQSLEEAIKKAMQEESIPETELFRLTITERTTIKTHFTELAKLVVREGKEINFDVTLTKDIREKLGSLVGKLTTTEQKTSVMSLKYKNK